MTKATYPEGWFDSFWSHLYLMDDEDTGIAAVRLIGEMIYAGIIHRDGDYLDESAETSWDVWLSPEDQLLIRQIEDAVAAANAEAANGS